MGSCNGYYRALDRKTGKVRWSYDAKQDGAAVEFHADPLVTEQVVVVGSDLRRSGAFGHVYAFERRSGRVRWKVPFPNGVTTDVQRFGSRIYFVTLADELVSLDLETGAVNWTHPSGAINDQFLPVSKPALLDDRVIFGDLDGGVTALDPVSGAVLWKSSLGARVSTSILAIDGALYLGTADGHLHQLDPNTGSVLADLPTGDTPHGPITRSGDSFLVFVGTKALACFGLDLKTERWVARSVAEWTSSRPYVRGETALAGDETGELVAFQLADGSVRWRRRVAGMIRGIGTSRDALFVGTLKGLVYALPAPGS